jgi:hypothetical protein
MQLDNIDPAFRKLADLLFFTDRTDIDTSNFLTLLGNNNDHYAYLWDRFLRSAAIYWEESFWLNRFEFILESKIKRLEQDIENHLLISYRSKFSYYTFPKYANEENLNIQYRAWIKAKSLKKEDLGSIRSFLLELPYITRSTNLISAVSFFIPYVFQDMDEYLEALSKKTPHSARSFEIIQELEKQGLKVNKQPLFKLASDMLLKKKPNRRNRHTFFAMINDIDILADLKANYEPAHHQRLLELISLCDYREIEELHLRNIKNLLALDSIIADHIMKVYADNLYSRGYGYKRANITRLIRVCKTCPQVSPKKVLVWLSVNNRIPDIKYLVKAFPSLKTLVLFV